jgi:hypothetical protein
MHNIYQKIAVVIAVAWAGWGFSLIKRNWKDSNFRIIEIELFIIYTLVIIFAGIVCSVFGVI